MILILNTMGCSQVQQDSTVGCKHVQQDSILYTKNKKLLRVQVHVLKDIP